MLSSDDTKSEFRASYDGELCSVRCKILDIPGTKGQWLGVEWDNPARGKHNGTYDGVQYFQCRSMQTQAASFIRPTRKPDPERTILEAIKYKYLGQNYQAKKNEAVVISGKIAEEIGFDKIIQEQSTLSDLRVVVLDRLVINGLAPRKSSVDAIRKAQEELAKTCPSVIELDLSHNPIEKWTDVEDICAALPRLRSLKLNSLRFLDLESDRKGKSEACFNKVQELHLNECLLDCSEIFQILGGSSHVRFPSLKSLWLSQNELSNFDLARSSRTRQFPTIQNIMLENNFFTSLDPLVTLLSLFPNTRSISLQGNKVSSIGNGVLPQSTTAQKYTTLANLNLSRNSIIDFSFIDVLPEVFPSLTALLVSKNPLYDNTASSSASASATETSYYLTLARIPHLKTLNYTDITAREREEGEIYYLSTTEKDIQRTVESLNAPDTKSLHEAITKLQTKYPHYQPLCLKHDRDDLLTALHNRSINDEASSTNINLDNKTTAPSISTPKLSQGTVASRLITSTFYTSNPSSPNDKKEEIEPQTSLTLPIPSPIPTSSIFARVSRALNLRPQTFKLIYESPELDPMRDDVTTRSQMYSTKSSSSSSAAVGAKVDAKSMKERWDDWADWDADAIVARDCADEVEHGEEGKGKVREVGGVKGGGMWIETSGGEKVLVGEDGRKWKRREVEVLFSMRGWGEWFETGVQSVKVRVEVGAKTVGLDLDS